ncbi:MAG TPA: dienelactone hydrolase family protein [Aggregatilineaceae bacterium]|nr:dienelactone hydrolase family protein [Aggregatilineaceae bacterium]
MQIHQTGTFREALTAVLGAPPDPAPLQPQVLDVVVERGYRREHVKYQAGLGDWCYAYLLVPLNLSAAAPTIFCHHRQGRYAIGKSEMAGLEGDPNEAVGVELVRRGYVVLAPDAIGYGERRSAQSSGESYDAAFANHQLSLRLLRGETLLRKLLWDVSCGIDYLETRSEVDSRFVGFVGHGYGGGMAVWSAAMEGRITAAVAHGGVITYREQLRRGLWFQPEFVVPRLMQVADMHHVLSLVAPRPFLLSVATPAQGADTAEIYDKARAVYDKQGVANRLALYRYADVTHADGGVAPDVLRSHMRQSIYAWLDSWLKPF